MLEYTCDKDNNCIKQDAFHLRPLPSFELLVQDATCTGVNDGIVSLDNDVVNLMDIVWASGEKKKMSEILFRRLHHYHLQQNQFV